MCGTIRRILQPLTSPIPVATPPYPWLVNCGRRQLPQVSLLETPGAEHLKQAYVYALRQGWASACVLALIDRCALVNEHERWSRAWAEVLSTYVLWRAHDTTIRGFLEAPSRR